MKKMGVREKRVLDYIQHSIGENGYAPSVRDISGALGYKSPSTVHLYLHRLEKLGYIRIEEGKSRAITLLSPAQVSENGVPVLGKVTAGVPVLASENFDGYLDFPPNRTKYSMENLFALRVSGTSMILAGICDGDYVVVSRSDYAENGEIVVAMIDDEATVKTFFKEDGHYCLRPENPEFEPIVVKELTVLGKVIAVVRYY